MELNIRQITESDWETLMSWWEAWPEWVVPVKDSLPDNGTGGFIVESNNKPVAACFLYFTNSKIGWIEWTISDPEYRGKDRNKAIEHLISTSELVLKEKGFKYAFSICRNKNLINKFKKLGWSVSNDHSFEAVKLL